MPTPKTAALQSKLNPIAKSAAGFRKNVGDKQFPAIADTMIAQVKQRRRSRLSDTQRGFQNFN